MPRSGVAARSITRACATPWRRQLQPPGGNSTSKAAACPDDRAVSLALAHHKCFERGARLNRLQAGLEQCGFLVDARDDVVARIDEEAALFKTRLQSVEARAAFEAFMMRKR